MKTIYQATNFLDKSNTDRALLESGVYTSEDFDFTVAVSDDPADECCPDLYHREIIYQSENLIIVLCIDQAKRNPIPKPTDYCVIVGDRTTHTLNKYNLQHIHQDVSATYFDDLERLKARPALPPKTSEPNTKKELKTTPIKPVDIETILESNPLDLAF